MLILTCEDVGLADPQALVLVNAAAEAFERVGQPEGYYLFAHATLYCATAPKSNSAKAISSALNHLQAKGFAPVPPHLRDKSGVLRGVAREKYQESMGDSPTSLYPQGWVAQNYLPEGLPPPHWYQPSEQGFEAGRAAEWRARRGGV